MAAKKAAPNIAHSNRDKLESYKSKIGELNQKVHDLHEEIYICTKSEEQEKLENEVEQVQTLLGNTEKEMLSFLLEELPKDETLKYYIFGITTVPEYFVSSFPFAVPLFRKVYTSDKSTKTNDYLNATAMLFVESISVAMKVDRHEKRIRNLEEEVYSIRHELRQLRRDDTLLLRGEAVNATLAGIMVEIGGGVWGEGRWQTRKRENGTRFERFVPDRTITELFHAYEYAKKRGKREPDYLLTPAEVDVYEGILQTKFGASQNLANASKGLRRMLNTDREIRNTKAHPKLTKDMVKMILADEEDAIDQNWLEKIGEFALNCSAIIERSCS